MLQMPKTSPTLDRNEISNLQSIILEEDEIKAFSFLKETVYPKLIRTQMPYDPLHGTIGFRRKPFGYRETDHSV